MTTRRLMGLVCLIAIVNGLFFIWYQRPDWNTQWSDQEGYRRLGQVLAQTGTFTRFPEAPRFAPEVIRTPAYPAFLALVYLAFGTSQLAVALVQTVLLAAICVAVFAIGSRVGGEPIALAAAAAVALFPPLPYFAALVMTEVWTTFMFTVSMWVALRALAARGAGWYALLGVLLAITALSRPVFVLFPLMLAAIGVVVLPMLRVSRRPSAAQSIVMLAAFAVAMLPWFTYNYVTLGRFTLSPAGGVGRGLWEGSWQASTSGRLQNELTHLADAIDDRAELDRRVSAVAGREGLPAGPMLEYVHQWEDIRKIWDTPTDPYERVFARIEADREYQRVALANIRRDSLAHLIKRLARGVFILWAGEIPFRYSDINTLAPEIIRVIWALQAVILCFAIAGLIALARRGRVAEASLLAAPLLYITAVHFPLLTEARQSLPAQPIVLLLATVGVANAGGYSLSLEPQLHEREHL
ncbi:MAG TPA: glycosyltransferase family 39 protein [Vicinamibacterales bacterium]|nr:glycosyltransferase family 39 protein [Vicinamibacterales bacterium]